jgi:hypothetical protein
MKLGLAIGAVVIAGTMAAYAGEVGRHFQFHRGGERVDADTNNDGWLSRDEASADADRMFADLDRNNDGRITDVDEEMLRQEIEAEVNEAMRDVHIELEGLNEEIEAELEGLDEEIEAQIEADFDGIDQNCETTTETVGATTRTTIVCNHNDDDIRERARDSADRARDHADRARDRAERIHDRQVDRHVRIVRHGDNMIVVPPVPPIPPIPPVPPIPRINMFTDSEADLNGDGAISREEFRAQQLRYFDAQDANRDGRVRFEEPPEAPEPPEPPEPPRRR